MGKKKGKGKSSGEVEFENPAGDAEQEVFDNEEGATLGNKYLVCHAALCRKEADLKSKEGKTLKVGHIVTVKEMETVHKHRRVRVGTNRWVSEKTGSGKLDKGTSANQCMLIPYVKNVEMYTVKDAAAVVVGSTLGTVPAS